MDLLAVWLGKLTLLALRSLGRRGNALPGLVVEKVFPRYLTRAMAALPEGVVVVSGTNGKTTTTKMAAAVLAQRYRVLTNDTGSNFVRGAITATVDAAGWTGRLPFDVAVFELDEAWAVRFVALVPPRRSLLLNVMRDQLDRFGEIDTTAALLGRVAAATTGHVVLNRDDQRIAALAAGTRADVSYYGVAAELRERFPNDEELYGGPVHVSTLTAAAQLQRLPNAEQPATTIRLAQPAGEGARSDDAGLDDAVPHDAVPAVAVFEGLGLAGFADHDVVLRAEGPHNAQNACGAAALGLTFGLDADAVITGLAGVAPAFGRGQSFTVDGRHVVLQLVKNPAGFRQTLRTVEDAAPAAIVVAINDDYADGRDVSWLWDVDFAALRGAVARMSTSGTRAADMALRLHYDDLVVDAVEPDLERAVRDAVRAVDPGERVVVFSTYTAMWALHRALERFADVPSEPSELSEPTRSSDSPSSEAVR